jgi:hypothetical protein
MLNGMTDVVREAYIQGMKEYQRRLQSSGKLLSELMPCYNKICNGDTSLQTAILYCELINQYTQLMDAPPNINLLKED